MKKTNNQLKLLLLFSAMIVVFSGCEKIADETIAPMSGQMSGQSTVNTMNDLKNFISPDDNTMVLLKGYYASNDGGGGMFYWDSSSSAASNDGTVVAVNNVATGRFIRVVEQNRLNVKWFGAKGDGVADDHPRIQAAINSLPNNGGTISFPGGRYLVSQTIIVGNGNGGTVSSTKNGVKLIGEGGGFAGSSTPTSIVATQIMDAVIELKGRISDCRIEGLFITGESKAKIGLKMTAVSGCVFKNFKIISYTEKGLVILGGGLPTGNYNIFNSFEALNVVSVIDNTVCLFIDGDYGAINDTWLTTFVGCRFDTHTTVNSKAAHFRFVDSISFYRCHFDAKNTQSLAMVFDALNNHDFPCGMAFYDCSIVSTAVLEDATHKIRKNYFYGYGTYDNEKVPTHTSLIGITDQGVPFNMDGIFTGIGLPPKMGEFETYNNAEFSVIKMNEPNESAAIRFNCGGTFKGGSFYLPSYGDNTGTIQLSVYKWKDDYATTVSGPKLHTSSFVNFTDNTWVNFNITETLPPSEYLVVFDGATDTGYGVGLWTKSKGSGIITYRKGQEAAIGIVGRLRVE